MLESVALRATETHHKDMMGKCNRQKKTSRISPAIPAVTSSRLIEGSLTEAAARKAAIETSVNIAKRCKWCRLNADTCSVGKVAVNWR